MTDVTSPKAIVCIPTFRRPAGLKRTLESLAAQTGAEHFAVVVVENDVQELAGERVADAVFASHALSGFSVIERKQGNCSAINTAFRTARERFPAAEFFLMIDDDEEASPTWLAGMIGTARSSGADLVGGPVVRCFEGETPSSLQKHPLFYSTITRSGETASLHGTGNCLIRRRVLEALGEPTLDPRFDLLGGGDMDFFTRCRLAGFKSHWNEDAKVFETVPAQRMKTRWVLRRSVTTGVINYTIDQKRYSGRLGTALLLLKNFISLGIAPFRAATALLATGHWLPASHPLCLSIGRSLAALGLAPTPYKAANITPLFETARDNASRARPSGR
ncbi:MAG TPA: glycosyltransferase family 2 protein [Bradyrhizobium sp.]|uniref:glycosyltransferase family 2 protein n=1 Tax=Bradyrhizobium sp. TaxID=376 RepID=UPI002CDC783F|nr:glycosyltransferase family 2 protein [Bradyrhizobium sp.]HLZ02381.1 glycosyltransferase family 2 protein [Bradyrhizobium sp.]